MDKNLIMKFIHGEVCLLNFPPQEQDQWWTYWLDDVNNVDSYYQCNLNIMGTNINININSDISINVNIDINIKISMNVNMIIINFNINITISIKINIINTIFKIIMDNG